ncbi:bifunctional metallophosphatase/5'-nucleotidase [Shewanella eurypsychrophilus]|uniref:Bifunctional metallophosphatase/5'-nucleotidase n=1 Tax=Shewanella eurypsychrophilus TaxID=2593656 RepID=A0ABX8S3X5_9GAMM|nr:MULTISPECIES: bifunctional metallophosphatase/5'-nucleotidase [Shewanella]QFU23562.1 bifunctional metallophosphatase/5'-nucleotidase [Shewanella sp. YLB-09]QXP44875.1 bifunctional metallophosphatase/5'-nucleotidase [Shewanella eurypsychrophilus]
MPYTLKLAHINDTHSHFDASRVKLSLNAQAKQFDIYSHSGGYARIKYQISQAKEQASKDNQAFLFLHAGDSFQGTLYFRQFKGVANAHLLNQLQPDAMVLGNHEIDAGNAPVLSFLNNIEFPLLAGNMDLSQEDPHKTSPMRGHPRLFDYDNETGLAKVLFKQIHDKPLAIIGITLDQMTDIARPDPDTLFVNAVDTTRKTVRQLKSQGIDHIILLSHLGLDQDRALAQAIDGISLIVGGHSHTLQGDFKPLGLSATVYGEQINGTPILHAGKHAETFGLADIRFDANGVVTQLNGHNYFMLDQQFILESEQGVTPEDYDAVRLQLETHPGILWQQEDPSITEIIATQYRPSIEALDKQVLGFVPKDLIHTRLPSKALPHGSEIAPWVCKSIYHEARRIHDNIDFALHNAGGVRQSLSKGNLTLADVVGRLLPFDLPLVKYQILGLYLFDALESAINSATNNSVTGTGAGSFPYTYGLKYCYDGRKPLGRRILSLEILCSTSFEETWIAVDKQQKYVGVSSAYTASGKEGYQPLLNAQWQRPIAELTLPNAFIRFMERAQTLENKLSPQLSYTSHR